MQQQESGLAEYQKSLAEKAAILQKQEADLAEKAALLSQQQHDQHSAMLQLRIASEASTGATGADSQVTDAEVNTAAGNADD